MFDFVKSSFELPIYCVCLLLNLVSVSVSAEMKTVYDKTIPVPGKIRLLLQTPSDEIPEVGRKTLSIQFLSKFSLKFQSIEVTEVDREYYRSTDKLKTPQGTQVIKNLLFYFPHAVNARPDLIGFREFDAPSEDKLYIIDVSGENARVVFKKSEYVIEIRDYDGDGNYDLIKMGGRGEPSNGFSYDPFLIYKQIIKNKKISFLVDERLSKKWSIENNYKWYGLTYKQISH